MLCRPAVLPALRRDVGHEIGDPGVAFPPVFVRIAKAAYDRLEELRLGRNGDIVNFLRFDRGGQPRDRLPNQVEEEVVKKWGQVSF